MRQPLAVLPVALLLLVGGCGGGRPPAVPEPAVASPALIPAPLVAALLGEPIGGGAARDIAVGTLPPGFPESLVPAGPVEILGGMVQGQTITVILADSTRRLAAVAEEQFERAGYTRPRERPGSGFFAARGPYTFFCRDNETVAAAPIAGAQHHHVRLTYRRLTGGNAFCDRVSPEPTADRLVLPELVAPPGLRVRTSGGGGSGSGGVESHAEAVGTRLVPAAVVAHYAKQLVAAGWTAADPAVSPRVAAQYFEARDSAGGRWGGVLLAAGSDSALSLTLDMKPRSSR